MALVLTRPTQLPRAPRWATGIAPAINNANILVNGNDAKFGCVVQPPKTGNLRKVHFRFGSMSAGGTDPVLDIRIETVAANGLPSGTLWGTNTNVGFPSPPFVVNTWYTSPALTADAVITDLNVPIAVVISNPPADAGSWTASCIGTTFTGAAARPYPLNYITVWGKFTSMVPILALEYSDGSIEHVPGVWPIAFFDTLNVTNAATPDEIGIRFSIPFKARLCGFWAIVQFSAATANFEMVFYNEAGTQTLLKTYDADLFRSTTYQMLEECFDDMFTLEPNTVYRLSYRPTTAINANVSYIDCASAALMAAMPGGEDFYWTERTNVGTWTDTTTRYPLMGILIDQLSDDV